MITTKEIIDYVMESPHNTNPSVLKSLLNQYSGSSGGGGPVKLSITHTVQDVDGTQYDFFYLNYTWRELKNFLDDGRVFIYESSDGSVTEQLPAYMSNSPIILDTSESDDVRLYGVTLFELFAEAPMRLDLAGINGRMGVLFEGGANFFTCQDEDTQPFASVPVQSGSGGGTTGK